MTLRQTFAAKNSNRPLRDAEGIMKAVPKTAAFFGERLRYLRSLKGLTQAELAGMAGLSVRQINRIEKGTSSPSYMVLEKLAESLEVGMAELFLFADENEGGPPRVEPRQGLPSPCLGGKNHLSLSLVGTWLFVPQSPSILWTESVYSLLGYRPNAVKPTVKRFLRHVFQEFRDDAAAFIAKARQGHQGRLFIKITTKSSKMRMIAMSAETYRQQPGQPDAVQLILQDVTDIARLTQTLISSRDALQEHVRERSKELELTISKLELEAAKRAKAEHKRQICAMMVQSSSDALLFMDKNGIITIVNKAYERLVGLSAENLVGKKYADFLISRWGKDFFEREIKDHLEQTLSSGKTFIREGWTNYFEQGRRFVRRQYSPCRDQWGIVGVVVTIHDLTDIEAVRDQLAESEARFRNLLAHVPSVAVQGYRMDGTTFYWNQASEHIYGYSSKEAVGRNLLELIIPPEMRGEVKKAMQRMAELGEPIPASELTLMRKDGSPVAVYSSHGVVRRSDGSLELFCIDVDLTERKQAEEALLLREQLLEVVVYATLDLLRGKELRPCIEDILAMLGSVTGTDRVYVFQNHRDHQSGALLTSQFYEWVRRGVTPQIDNPDLQNFTIGKLCPRWVKEMESGNAIMGLVHDFPEEERSILEPQKIQSLLAVPILDQGELWGFIGFDSVRSPRDWSLAEANVLRIIATAIGSAITRKAMEKSLRIKDLALSSALDAVALADMDGYVTYVNPAFLKIWRLQREEDALGRNITTFWHDTDHAVEVMHNVLQHVGTTERMIAKTADGRLVTVQVSANIVRDKKGNPIGMMASFRDMAGEMHHEREAAKAFSPEIDQT